MTNRRALITLKRPGCICGALLGLGRMTLCRFRFSVISTRSPSSQRMLVTPTPGTRVKTTGQGTRTVEYDLSGSLHELFTASTPDCWTPASAAFTDFAIGEGINFSARFQSASEVIQCTIRCSVSSGTSAIFCYTIIFSVLSRVTFSFNQATAERVDSDASPDVSNLAAKLSDNETELFNKVNSSSITVRNSCSLISVSCNPSFPLLTIYSFQQPPART